MTRSSVAIFVLLFAAPLAASARSALVELRDGRTLKGDLTAGPDGWRLAAAGDEPLEIVAAELVRVRFLAATAATARPIPLSENTGGALPRGWTAWNMGASYPAGLASFRTNTFLLEGSGFHFWSRMSDSFLFVGRTLRGDGELTVRLLESEAKGAGLMVRASGKANVPMAAMGVWKGMLIYRNRAGTNTPPRGQHPGLWLNRKDPKYPVWLRLARRGQDVAGYVSFDEGVNWQLFNEGPVELGREAVVGLFVMSGTNELLSARFDQVVVTEYANRPATNTRPRVSLVLRDGSVILGELKPMRDGDIVVSRGGRDFAVTTNELARVLFQTFATPTGGADLPDRTGLRIAKGDFLEGDFLGLDPSGVRMSSVIFGLKSYPLDKEAKALVLQAIQPDAAAWEIKTADGSIWRGAAKPIGANEVEVRLAAFGPVRLRWDELAEITGGR